MKASELESMQPALDDDAADDGPQVSLLDILTWLGEGKRSKAKGGSSGTPPRRKVRY